MKKEVSEFYKEKGFTAVYINTNAEALNRIGNKLNIGAYPLTLIRC